MKTLEYLKHHKTNMYSSLSYNIGARSVRNILWIKKTDIMDVELGKPRFKCLELRRWGWNKISLVRASPPTSLFVKW